MDTSVDMLQDLVGLEELNITKTLNPVTLAMMDVNDFVRTHGCMEVRSHSIHVASTNQFHPEGLFSEEIFGQIGSPHRLVKFGYIKLNTKVYQPIVYRTICKLKKIYAGIMNGSVHAKFDEEDGDFIQCSADDTEGSTGYSFFVKNFPRVKLYDNNSTKRGYMIKLLDKYVNNWYCDKLLVIPAGLRDIRATDQMLAQEDVNKLYLAALSYANKIPVNTTNAIYDILKINLIKKMLEIYTYLENILSGKRGFLRGAYGKRTVAFGTGNVIAAYNNDTNSPDDPRCFRADETITPLYQTMKAFQPFILHYLYELAFTEVFPIGSAQISAINKRTLKLEYIDPNDNEVNTYKTIEGLEDHLNGFKNLENRFNPITIHDKDKKEYYLYLVYDLGDTIMLFRNIDDIKVNYPDVKREDVRPLTWVELMYMITYITVKDKHAYITRYPIGQGPESVYPSRLRLLGTTPNRLVTLKTSGTKIETMDMPHYPVMDGKLFDAMCVHPSKLNGLSGDMDGDMVSLNGVWSKDANKSIDEYFDSWRSIISPQQELMSGGTDHIIEECIYALTSI